MTKIIDLPPNEPPKIPMPIDPDILTKYMPQTEVKPPSFCHSCQKNIRTKDEYGWYCNECKEY